MGEAAAIRSQYSHTPLNVSSQTPRKSTVTIADNDPPETTITSRPADPSVSPLASFAFIGSEPTSAIARFDCSLDGAPFSVCTSPVSYSSLVDGSHTFLVRAVAKSGNADPTPASFTWTIDTNPPAITIAASPMVLWPANGKLVPVTIRGAITDALSGVDAAAAFRVVDDYGEVQPTGPVALDTVGRYSFLVSLEARRLGQDLDGRHYEVIVSALDKAGNRTSQSTVVTVPHDQGQ